MEFIPLKHFTEFMSNKNEALFSKKNKTKKKRTLPFDSRPY